MTQMILPVVTAYASDRVPNIRFNVAKTLAAIAPLLDRPVVDTRVKSTLNELTNDADIDVKYFARVALTQIA